MKKISVSLASLILLFSTGMVIAMEVVNTKKMMFDKEFEKFPKELKKEILLLTDAIGFLCWQPLTLAGPHGHTDAVIALAVSNDRVVTGSWNSGAKIWDLYTGKCLFTLSEHLYIEKIVISHDKVVSLCSAGTVKVWNIYSGAFVHELALQMVTSVALCRDKVIAWSERELPGIIKIWNIHTGELVYTLEHSKFISVAVSNDKLISWSVEGIIKIWDINTGKLLHEFEQSGKIFLGAAHKNKIGFGSFEEATNRWNVKIKDVTTGEVKTLLGANEQRSSINLLGISDDKVVARADDYSAKIWNIATGELVFCGPSSYTPLIIIEDKVIVVPSLASYSARVWDMKKSRFSHFLEGHVGPIRVVAPGYNTVITGSEDYTAKIWPLQLNVQGTSDNNPLVWIIEKADKIQLSFIKSAYEATIGEKDFIIDMPKKLGALEKNESLEQLYGRIYFTFPEHAREYLRNRLNIRRDALLMEKVEGCLIQ
ncbi:hypothetical protein H0X06_01605 [Candidatus Dependentiae bacterium]|nr:hypothetical protein [Candidatus Dependentiae bacterium]